MPTGQRPWVGGPTDEIREAIAAAVEKRSMPVSHAAALAGVHPRTVQRWLEQGAKDIDSGDAESVHAVFAAAIARARAAKVGRLLADIETIAKTENAVTGVADAKPLMWTLERTEPEFRARTETEVNARVEQVDPRERLESLLGRVASRGGEGAVAPKPEPSGS